MFLALARIAAAPVVALAATAPAGSGWTLLALALFSIVSLIDLFDLAFLRRNAARPAYCVLVERTGDRVMVITTLAVVIGMSASYRGAGTGALAEVPAVAVALPALVIVIREILVSGLREHLGAANLPITPLARAKAALQLIAVFLLLLVHALPALEIVLSRGTGGIPPHLFLTADPPYQDELVIAGLACLWLATAVTVWSAIDYFRKGWPQVFVDPAE